MNRYGFFVTTHFNPRSREGSDFILQSLASLYIHFNPRSREGSDGFGYPDG